MHRTVLGLLSLAAASQVPRATFAQEPVIQVAMQRGPSFYFAGGAKDVPIRLDAKRTPVLSRRITLDLRDVPLEDALTMISRQAGLKLVYSKAKIPLDQRISIKAEEITVAGALSEVLFDVDVDVMFSASAQAMLVPRSTAAAVEALGVISGRVFDAASNAALPLAQINVVGTSIGRITDDSGRYTLANVPAGNQKISARHVGYAPQTKDIVVANGSMTSVDFALTAQASRLSEVVVTGTPTATRQRELGNTIGTIDVENDLKDMPIANVQQLFQAREPGLLAIGGSGAIGSAMTIRLRGQNSIAMSNQALIYVDGIRVNQSINLLPGAYAFGDVATTRLTDLPVSDIARVEIIKGASATTLYGSEASGGVIQIFTKRGSNRPAELSIHVEGGYETLPHTLPYPYPDHSKYPSANDFIKKGLVQNYDVSLRGGTTDLTYYASGNYNQDNGSWPSNSLKKGGGRLNVSLVPANSLSMDLNASYLWTDAVIPSTGGGSTTNLMWTILFGDPVTRATAYDPWGGANYRTPDILRYTGGENFARFVGGMTLNHALTSAVHQRLMVGFDGGSGSQFSYFPYIPGAPGGGTAGTKNYRDIVNVLANVDYAATWTTNLFSKVKSDFSLGGQLSAIKTELHTLTGTTFAVPDFETIGGSTTQTVSESRIRTTTGGFFAQEGIGMGDRLFITAGVRVDGSSTFGEQFGNQTYPKLSVSYVISDESWFRLPAVSSLKLRAAWGKAGKLPSAFSGLRNYTAVSTAAGTVGLRLASPGNPILGPEVSRELEGGFDLGAWDERVTLRTTAYFQHTDGAIQNVPLAESGGFIGSQLYNFGAVQNRGIELGLDATLLRTRRAEWSVNAGYSYNANKVVNIYGSAPINAISTSATRIGFPLGALIAPKSAGFDTVNNKVTIGDTVYFGPGFPPATGSFGSRLHFRAFDLSANAQWAHGGYNYDGFRVGRALGFHTGEEYYTTLLANNNNINAPAVQYLLQRNQVLGDVMEHSDWLKLREITLSYAVPLSFTGGRKTSLYVSGRNLKTVTSYSGVDPEVQANPPVAGIVGYGFEGNSLPQPRYYLVGATIALTGRAR